jgi:hypothetical protein
VAGAIQQDGKEFGSAASGKVNGNRRAIDKHFAALFYINRVFAVAYTRVISQLAPGPSISLHKGRRIKQTACN